MLIIGNQKKKWSDYENDGYVICFPSNKLNRENIFDPKIYNRIKSYFSLNSKYKNFVSSINEIENNEINSFDVNKIKNLIWSQRKTMDEFLVYILDKYTFKKIRRKIYSDDYEKLRIKDKKLKEIKKICQN